MCRTVYWYNKLAFFRLKRFARKTNKQYGRIIWKEMKYKFLTTLTTHRIKLQGNKLIHNRFRLFKQNGAICLLTCRIRSSCPVDTEEVGHYRLWNFFVASPTWWAWNPSLGVILVSDSSTSVYFFFIH